jgi:hypothetical protein
MSNFRMHLKSGVDPIKFLRENNRTFAVEKTSTGFPTIIIDGKRMYVRDFRQTFTTLNKIISFKKKVNNSKLFNFIKNNPNVEIESESSFIEKSILYKGFNFNIQKEKEFQKVIKIDLNSAYWQTCRYMKLIDKNFFQEVSDGCVKSTRLMITGTLGKSVMVTEYNKGNRVKSYVKQRDAKILIQNNIYNRVRKFVDELMVWAWKKDPFNFIGYYVDCIWLREFDIEMFDTFNKIFNLKIDLVNLNIQENKQGKINLIEHNEQRDENKIYDVQFKINDFAKYKNLYNFTKTLQDININSKWKK